MKILTRRFLFVVLLGIGIAGTVPAQNVMPYTVSSKGAMRTMFEPNGTTGKIRIKPLLAKPHLYALGPLDKLAGEIIVWDGKLRVSKVNGDVVQTTSPPDAKAIFLVWTYVSRWREINIPDDVRTYKQLELFVAQKAVEAGVNSNKPFPLLLKGKVETATFHVVNYTPDGTPLTREAHDASKAQFPVENETVNVLGFYSTKHKDIWTHHTTNLHLHLMTADGEKMGHLDDIVPSKTLRLYLPKLGN
jgi:acetolactate decarboxylase